MSKVYTVEGLKAIIIPIAKNMGSKKYISLVPWRVETAMKTAT